VGVVFSPAGDRMYFGMQRSFPVGVDALPAGVVYEISGPFRKGSPGGGGGGKIELRTKRRRRIDAFLEKGLSLHLELPDPVGIKASLKLERGKRTVTIGRVKSDVALEGDVALEVKPVKAAERLLKNAERARAKLTVVATRRNGDRTVLRRAVQLRG